MTKESVRNYAGGMVDAVKAYVARAAEPLSARMKKLEDSAKIPPPSSVDSLMARIASLELKLGAAVMTMASRGIKVGDMSEIEKLLAHVKDLEARLKVLEQK